MALGQLQLHTRRYTIPEGKARFKRPAEAQLRTLLRTNEPAGVKIYPPVMLSLFKIFRLKPNLAI